MGHQTGLSAPGASFFMLSGLVTPLEMRCLYAYIERASRRPLTAPCFQPEDGVWSDSDSEGFGNESFRWQHGLGGLPLSEDGAARI
jgi:hypothetical protein